MNYQTILLFKPAKFYATSLLPSPFSFRTIGSRESAIRNLASPHRKPIFR